MERLGQLAWNTQSCKSATRAAALCGGQEIRSRLEIEGLPRMGALQDRETSREEAPSTFHTLRSVRPLQKQRLGELAGLVWNCLGTTLHSIRTLLYVKDRTPVARGYYWPLKIAQTELPGSQAESLP